MDISWITDSLGGKVETWAQLLTSGLVLISICKFVDAVIKPEVFQAFVSMPSEQEMGENMQEVWEKYKLPNVISGTDGCHYLFREKPRFLIRSFIVLCQI